MYIIGPKPGTPTPQIRWEVNQIDAFSLSSKRDFVRVVLEETFEFPDRTSHFGGYDGRGTVEIRCGNYHVTGALWFSTGEVWQFYTELRSAYDTLTGQARFRSGEGNLDMVVRVATQGHIVIEGTYQEEHMDQTRLIFALACDQSYLVEPLAQLGQFVATYGDNQGLRR